MKDVSLIQEYYAPQTSIKWMSERRISVPEDPKYKIKTIYYHNGDVDTTSRNSSNGWMQLNTLKVIDSIAVTANYEILADYQKYDFKNSISIDGGKIEVKKI